jgi:hypothetical protein
MSINGMTTGSWACTGRNASNTATNYSNNSDSSGGVVGRLNSSGGGVSGAVTTITIPNYQSRSFYTSQSSDGDYGTSGAFTAVCGGVIAQTVTAAISSISFTGSSTTLGTGSTAVLYGIQ